MMNTTKTGHLNKIVTLNNGAFVTLRPIKPDDALYLQALFSRLSPQSIYFRFLEIRKALRDDDAKRLTEIDYQKSMTLAAVDDPKKEKNIIAVARYEVLYPGDPDVADASIVVEDQYQRLGLGTFLLVELATCASTHGIRTFSAVIHNDNLKIWRFIQNFGLPVKRKLIERGVWEIQVKIAIDYNDKLGDSHVQENIGTT